MNTIRMLVRTAWRRGWRASIFLAVVAGLAASVVGASFQAAARAGSSLERFSHRNRVFDLLVQGCPPDVSPDSVQDQAELQRLCVNPQVTERFRSVLGRVPGVDRTAVVSTLVVALLDPSASNHWGRLTLLGGVRTLDGASVPANPIVVRGRLYDPNAADEVVLSEAADRVTGLRVGDVVRIAGWRQADLDAAADGLLAPQTHPFNSRVVGVVRGFDDVQATGTGLGADTIPGDLNVLAGPGWLAAHRADIADVGGYGSGVLVRVGGGAAALDAFQAGLNSAPPEGWFNQVSPINNSDPTSVRKVIDLERRALLLFAAIASLASVVFVGLIALRQFRREPAESASLMTLGMTRRDLRTANVARALTIAAPACLVATVGIVALSPLGPLGLARKLEFDVSVRFDPIVVATAVAALLVVFVACGLISPVDTRVDRRVRQTARASRLQPARLGLGPVAVASATVARGRSARTTVAVTAVAVAAVVGAGGLVASYDRLIASPQRYGAWWDVVVGQYSQPGAFDEGIAKLRANPAVVAASGYLEQTDIGTVDGHNAPFLALVDYIGQRGPVMADGREPRADNEVAIGRDTARTIHKGIGDEVTVVSNSDKTIRLRVVGILVINDPITTSSRAGEGVYVRPQVFGQIVGIAAVAQSIVIKLDPTSDRNAAIASVRKDFPGSIRTAAPLVDVLNLGRLRAVPWFIASLIAILALATLMHTVITMLDRNRTSLAVLAALGFTRGQRREVGVAASTVPVLVGTVLGVPIGFIVATRVWSTISNSFDLPSPSAIAWLTTVVASVGALGMAALVAVAASGRNARTTAGEALGVE